MIKNKSIQAQKKKYFYYHNDFLSNSLYRKSVKKVKVENIISTKVSKFNKFNTLVIDAEGIEKYYIKNIKFLPNIEFLFFELHYDILNLQEIKKIKNILIKNNFFLVEKHFNSFFYRKSFI